MSLSISCSTQGSCSSRWKTSVRRPRSRSAASSARRNVVIHLQNEARSDIVMTGKLSRAWPAKYTGPRLARKGNDVAIESLEIAFERLEVE